MGRTAKLVTVGLLVVLSACGRTLPSSSKHRLSEAWDPINDPSEMQTVYKMQLGELPTDGIIDVMPWSDSYWPSREAGIASRWNSGQQVDHFKYKPYPLRKLRKMSREELSELSPAEKYDIFVGNYDYDLVKYERQRTSPDDEGWFGLCHGWAPASLNFIEPAPINLINGDGIAIPFGSSDIKALLTFVEQFSETEGLAQSLGGRCDIDISKYPERATNPECRDVNPGSLHIVLANQIGLLKQGFVADVYRDIQVWNQPIFGFTSRIVATSTDVYASAAPGTASIATVETTIRYILEKGPDWERLPVAEYPDQVKERFLKYTLELDADGKIIGGEWVEGERPDFLWKQEKPTFSGYFEQLKTIYEESIKANQVH